MLSRIQQFFTEHLQPGVDPDHEHAINLAAAALLVEVARADFTIDDDEAAVIERLLVDTLGLSESEVAEIVDLAKAEIAQGSSLHEFTRLINEHYPIAEKRRFMEQLWRVAAADGRIDDYEEHLLRRLADLLHLRHPEFIKAKHSVVGG